MKYINADKLIERLDDKFHEEVSIEYIKSLIDELSEEREDVCDYCNGFGRKDVKYQYTSNALSVENINTI